MLKKFKPKLSIIIPVIILFLLAFTYRDVLRSMVLVPLAYAIFIGQLIAGTIGQQTLWISFVVFSGIVAVISLAMRREDPAPEIPPERKYRTRLQTWLKSIERRERSKYFQWNLAQELSTLTIEAIAYRQGISREQAARQLEAGQLDIPPDILAYLQISQKPFTHTGLASYNYDNWFTQTWKKLTRQTSDHLNGTKTPLDLEPEVVIRFLEDYLELEPEIWAG